MSRGTSKLKATDAVTAAAVEDYLRRHPEFFEAHLELLESLKVPHPVAPAVSLITRQVQQLRDKNRRLQTQMSEIVQIARDNEGLRQRIHQLTLVLLDAKSLEDALAGLRWSLHAHFQTDFVAVRLTAPAVESPLADLRMAPESPGAALFAPLLDAGQPRCGRPEPEQAACLFGRDAAEVASQALVPLRHAGLQGLLAIGSRDPDRFTPGMGMLFLSQMGEILSARLAALLHEPA